MSGEFRGCIDEAAAKGEIDAETAEALRETYDDAFAAASDVFGPSDADRRAAEMVMQKVEREAVEAERQRTLTVRRRREILQGIDRYKALRGYTEVAPLPGRGGSGRPPKGGWVQGGRPPPTGEGSTGALAARALELLAEGNAGLAGGPFASVEGRYRAIRGSYDAHMADLIEKFEAGLDANLLGKRNRAALGNMVREAFGEDTGDLAARALAQAWAGTAERARLEFNAAGGSIGKIDNWGLPQMHDAISVRAAGRDGWVQSVMPRLDRAKMIDRNTGQPFTDKRLQAVLGQTWDRIVSNGAINTKPGEHLGKGLLANTRGEQRFLAFKTADDWMAYQEEFGEADPFAAMMGHLDEMARDIAQLQILGPNPAYQWEWLKRWAQREADLEYLQGVDTAKDKAAAYLKSADEMMSVFTGSTSTPVNSKLANIGANVRAGMTAVSLGGTILTDLPSAPYFGFIARVFSGLGRTGDMTALAKLIASPESRKTARRSGFIIEQATDGFVRATHDNLRLATVGGQGEGFGNAFVRRLPAAVLRSTGMTGFAAARKRSFQFEFMGALADRVGKSLADLKAGDAEDRAFAELMDARGFTENDWSKVRSTPLWRPDDGVEFLRPADIEDRELALRFSEMIDWQTRQAVPETTLWTRARLLGSSRPGSWQGEFWRSYAMFRSFTLTVAHLYAEDIVLRSGRNGTPLLGTARHAAGAVVYLTLAAAISIQMREVSKGNEPRDMTDWRFWGAAFTAGGGVPLLGDFLYAATARNGKTAGVASYGPVGQAVSDFWNATGGNVMDVAGGLADGESLDKAVGDARIGRDVTNIVRRYSPFSTHVLTRAAWSRGVADQLQKLLDPDAEEDFERRAKRIEDEYGAGQWWDEGQALPAG